MRFLIFALFMVLSPNAIAQEGQRPTPESHGVPELLQEKPPEQPVGPNPTQQEPGEQPTMEVELASPEIAPTEPSSTEHDGTASKDRERSANDSLFWGDGVAQWVMALTGVAAFGLSAWAVGLLYCTLKATRKMVIEARKTTAAAKSAVKETRRIGEAQVRAYLRVDIIDGQVEAGKPVKFTARIFNHGQSPAYKVAPCASVVLRSIGWKWESDESSTPIGNPPEAIIHSGGYRDIHPDIDPPQPLTEEHILRLKSDESAIFISVLVYFEDVFETKREAQFRFEFSGEECFDRRSPRVSREGNYERGRKDGQTA